MVGGLEFRSLFLYELDNQEWWDSPTTEITLNFKGVSILTPGWANEVFAYYLKYADKDRVKDKIHLINISAVKEAIIDFELEEGYYGRL